ncbi:MAG: site-specific DNA-methyltransferase [Melioribacteraceae bacterium]|nr:site-specific DNA-methyltransferase [Melioribacteraceae bacterium]
MSLPKINEIFFPDESCAYYNNDLGVILYNNDSLKLMDLLIELFPEGIFDMIFADPPYFLSNGGITCHAGKMTKVNKGEWDKSKGVNENHEFNLAWLSKCQKLLKKDGTLWVTGTNHVIYSVGFAIQQLEMKILNDISWEKPNPPPNLSCRYFTHSTETIIWAAKTKNSKHKFNYELMRNLNRGKQMKTVWTISAPNNEEKKYGKHPTQKPYQLLERIILACTDEKDIIFDPFSGSSTTAIAAIKNNRFFVGSELDKEYINLSIKRIEDAIESKKNHINLFEVNL